MRKSSLKRSAIGLVLGQLFLAPTLSAQSLFPTVEEEASRALPSGYILTEKGQEKYEHQLRSSTDYGNKFNTGVEFTTDAIALIPLIGDKAAFFAKWGIKVLPDPFEHEVKKATIVLLTNHKMKLSQITGNSAEDIAKKVNLRGELLRLTQTAGLSPDIANQLYGQVIHQMDQNISEIAKDVDQLKADVHDLQSSVAVNAYNSKSNSHRLFSVEQIVNKLVADQQISQQELDDLKSNKAMSIRDAAEKLEEVKLELEEKIAENKEEITQELLKQHQAVTEKLSAFSIDISKRMIEISKKKTELEQTKDETKRKLLLSEIKQLEEVQKAEDLQNNKLEIEAAAENLNALSNILLFVDPALAKDVQVLSDVVVKTALLANALENSTFAATGLGPYGAVAGSLFTMIQHFKASKKPTAEEVISGQIKKLSQQVEQFRLQMHARFDRIEEMISFGHRQIIESFGKLDKKLDRLSDQISTLTPAFNYLNDEILNIRQDIRKSQLNSITLSFEELNNQCLNYQPATKDDPNYFMSIERYQECLDDYKTWHVNAPENPIFVGDQESDFNFIANSDYYKSGKFEYALGSIKSYMEEQGISDFPEVVNPITWFHGVNNTLDLMEQNVIHGKPYDVRLKSILNGQNGVKSNRVKIAELLDYIKTRKLYQYPQKHISLIVDELPKLWDKVQSDEIQNNEHLNKKVENHLNTLPTKIRDKQGDRHTKVVKQYLLSKDNSLIPNYDFALPACSGSKYKFMGDQVLDENAKDFLSKHLSNDILRDHYFGNQNLRFCYSITGSINKLKRKNVYGGHGVWTFKLLAPKKLIIKGFSNDQEILNVSTDFAKCHMFKPSYKSFTNIYDFSKTNTHNKGKHPKFLYGNLNAIKSYCKQSPFAKLLHSENTLKQEHQEKADEAYKNLAAFRENIRKSMNAKLVQTIEADSSTLSKNSVIHEGLRQYIAANKGSIADALNANQNILHSLVYFDRYRAYALNPQMAQKVYHFTSRRLSDLITTKLIKETWNLNTKPSDEELSETLKRPLHDLISEIESSRRVEALGEYTESYGPLYLIESRIKLISEAYDLNLGFIPTYE